MEGRESGGCGVNLKERGSVIPQSDHPHIADQTLW